MGKSKACWEPQPPGCLFAIKPMVKLCKSRCGGGHWPRWLEEMAIRQTHERSKVCQILLALINTVDGSSSESLLLGETGHVQRAGSFAIMPCVWVSWQLGERRHWTQWTFSGSFRIWSPGSLAMAVRHKGAGRLGDRTPGFFGHGDNGNDCWGAAGHLIWAL